MALVSFDAQFWRHSHEEPHGVEEMGLRIPLGIQILCGQFFPPTLGKVPANTFGLENLNLATFDDKKSQFFTMPLPFFGPPVAPHAILETRFKWKRHFTCF